MAAASWDRIHVGAHPRHRSKLCSARRELAAYPVRVRPVAQQASVQQVVRTVRTAYLPRRFSAALTTHVHAQQATALLTQAAS